MLLLLYWARFVIEHIVFHDGKNHDDNFYSALEWYGHVISLFWTEHVVSKKSGLSLSNLLFCLGSAESLNGLSICLGHGRNIREGNNRRNRPFSYLFLLRSILMYAIWPMIPNCYVGMICLYILFTQLYLIAYVITPCILVATFGYSRLVIVITILSPLYSFLERVLISSIL